MGVSVGAGVGTILVTIFIIVITLYAIFRLLRVFGFPFCGRTQFSCICSPFCYCLGVHLRADHTGTLKVIPCSECYYSNLCGCKRPPPEMLTSVNFRWTALNRIRVNSHEAVMRIMQLGQRLIPSVVSTQPTGAKLQEQCANSPA